MEEYVAMNNKNALDREWIDGKSGSGCSTCGSVHIVGQTIHRDDSGHITSMTHHCVRHTPDKN